VKEVSARLTTVGRGNLPVHHIVSEPIDALNKRLHLGRHIRVLAVFRYLVKCCTGRGRIEAGNHGGHADDRQRGVTPGHFIGQGLLRSLDCRLHVLCCLVAAHRTAGCTQ